jgi:hypothetical protein
MGLFQLLPFPCVLVLSLCCAKYLDPFGFICNMSSETIVRRRRWSLNYWRERVTEFLWKRDVITGECVEAYEGTDTIPEE